MNPQFWNKMFDNMKPEMLVLLDKYFKERLVEILPEEKDVDSKMYYTDGWNAFREEIKKLAGL